MMVVLSGYILVLCQIVISLLIKQLVMRVVVVQFTSTKIVKVL